MIRRFCSDKEQGWHSVVALVLGISVYSFSVEYVNEAVQSERDAQWPASGAQKA